MQEGISATGSMDFEEILILTPQIGLWKSNSVPKTSWTLNKFEHHTTWIFASISIFWFM